MPTLSDLVREHITKLNPLATVYVAVFQAVSRAVVGEHDAVLYIPWGSFGRVVFVAETPYVEDDLGNPAPSGIRYFVASAAPDEETALQFLVYVAGRLHTQFQLSANAAAFAIQARLITVWRRGSVPFRELLFEPEIGHPINSRLIDVEATQHLCSASWLTDEERVGRASVQYELALRRLEQNEQPLALAHLYMGIEAITKAVIRQECTAKAMTERELGSSLGLDPENEAFGKQFEPEVRKQIIFQGDEETYKAAKRFSDGLEHGFASWGEIWSVPEEVFPATARYLRSAIFRTLALPDQIGSRLLSPPYENRVEGGPRIAYEAQANVSEIDLRATDFKIANLQRVMTSSHFDTTQKEFRYEYTSRPAEK